MNILKRIPAGVMIIPMFIAIIINTFFPELLLIGSFTTKGFSNEAAATIMSLQLFCIGSQVKISSLGKVIKRGGVLFLGKIMLGILVILIIRKEGICGISIITILSCLTNVNGNIYLSIVSCYGDEIDGAANVILSLTNGPMLVMILLGVGGIGEFSLINLIATALPIVIGIILGNISKLFKESLKSGVVLLIPFIGFTLGAGIKLNDIFLAGIKGVILTVIILVINIVFMFFIDRFIIKRPGFAGIATCATGVNAITIPASMALINPYWEETLLISTTHIVAVSIISSVTIPIVIGYFYKNKL